MRTKFFLIIILASWCWVSCDFTPKGDNFKVVPQPDLTGLTVMLDPDVDSVFLYGNALLNFIALTPHQNALGTTVYLNDQFVATNFSPPYISFPTDQFPDGVYKLRLTLRVTSGTASLAELTGGEIYEVSKEYIAVIDNSELAVPLFNEVVIKNGTALVSWKKYHGFGFQSYTISKSYYSDLFQGYRQDWTKVITNVDSANFSDSTFVGGIAHYSVIVSARHQTNYAQKDFQFVYPMALTWEMANKTQVKFSWTKSPLYANAKYVLTFNQFDDPRSFEIQSANDTTMTVDGQLTFDKPKNAIVYVYPKQRTPDYLNTVHSGYTNIFIGTAFPIFKKNKIVYSVARNSYYVASDLYPYPLNKIDATTLAVQSSIAAKDSDIGISSNGQYLYGTSGNFLNRYDPGDMSLMQSYYLGYKANIGAISGFTVADNNWVGVVGNFGRYVFDMNTFTVVQTWDNGFSPFALSPQGNYVVIQGSILKWNGTQYAEVGTYTSTNEEEIVFVNEDRVLINQVNGIKVINLATRNLERTITTPTYNLRYDPVSGFVSGLSIPSGNQGDFVPSKLNLIDPQQNNIVRQIDVYGNVVLQNATMIVPTGRKVPLSLYYP